MIPINPWTIFFKTISLLFTLHETFANWNTTFFSDLPSFTVTHCIPKSSIKYCMSQWTSWFLLLLHVLHSQYSFIWGIKHSLDMKAGRTFCHLLNFFHFEDICAVLLIKASLSEASHHTLQVSAHLSCSWHKISEKYFASLWMSYHYAAKWKPHNHAKITQPLNVKWAVSKSLWVGYSHNFQPLDMHQQHT
jgi:hypothetical protein